MTRAHRPEKVKLIVGLLASQAPIFEETKTCLERSFGKIDFESRILEFKHTDYYRKELGGELKRLFLSFEKPIDPAEAYKTKLRTGAIERRFLKDGKRTVNIDPGYLDLSKVVLLSTKDYSHRIYLDKAIFAEVTLFYKDRTYNPWPWTYPDYRTEDYITIFNSIRSIYKDKREK